MHEHPGRAVVEVQQPGSAARSSSRWTLSTSAAPRARAARATCPGPPERSRTVRPSRSISSSAGHGGRVQQARAVDPHPLRLPHHEPLDVRADRGHLRARAPHRRSTASACPSAIVPIAARVPSASTASRRNSPAPSRAPTCTLRQEPAVGGPRPIGMRGGEVRRRLAHRGDADEPVVGPDLHGERARLAPEGPSAHHERRRTDRPSRRPVARCPRVTSATPSGSTRTSSRLRTRHATSVLAR